jgi:hypothetical protein
VLPLIVRLLGGVALLAIAVLVLFRLFKTGDKSARRNMFMALAIAALPVGAGLALSAVRALTADDLTATEVRTFTYRSRDAPDVPQLDAITALCEPSRSSSRQDAFRCILPMAVEAVVLAGEESWYVDWYVDFVGMDRDSPVAIADPCFLDNRVSVPQSLALPPLEEGVEPPAFSLGCPRSDPEAPAFEIFGLLLSHATLEQAELPADRTPELATSTFWMLELEDGRICWSLGRIPVLSVGGDRASYMCMPRPRTAVTFFYLNKAGLEFDGEYVRAVDNLPPSTSFVIGAPDESGPIHTVEHLANLSSLVVAKERVRAAWR